MSSVNLYDVLNVSHDATLKEIKSSYRRLAKEYHPDRADGDSDMFELVSHAYTILTNPNTRKEYNDLYNLSLQADNDHFKLKSQSIDYHELSSRQTKKMSKDESKRLYEEQNKELNRKHNYNDEDKNGLKKDDTDRRIDDLRMMREQDDIENVQDNLFESDKFDLDEFNATYDKYGSNLVNSSGQVVEHVNPMEYNSISYCNYGSLNDYGKLYNDRIVEDGLEYARVDLSTGSGRKKIKKVQLSDVDREGYRLRHMEQTDIEKRLEEQMMARENDMNMEFDKYQPASESNYGIFGEDLGISKADQITWDVEDMRDNYKKLLSSRRDN